jgi:hypothetical protein
MPRIDASLARDPVKLAHIDDRSRRDLNRRHDDESQHVQASRRRELREGTEPTTWQLRRTRPKCVDM